MTNKIFKNNINITVLVTSASQREITLQTVNYYSQICSEVIFIDEQKPYLSETEVNRLTLKGIKYIPYEFDSQKGLHNSPYKKRLVGANVSKNEYLVHSNHDERYTTLGLLECVKELENNKDLSFCIGQAIAIRKNNSKIHFTRSYKNLSTYENINNTNQRLYYHAETYAPLAHYSVWRKQSYIDVTEKTIETHESLHSSTILEEIIFELAADIEGNSKAIPELFWIRNRINPPTNTLTERGEHVFKIIQNKLEILLCDIDDLKIEILMSSFRRHFTFVRPSYLERIIIFIKRNLRKIFKKKQISNINSLLVDNRILYDKDDLSFVIESMTQ